MFRDLLTLRSEMDFGALDHQRSPYQAALSNGHERQTGCKRIRISVPQTTQSRLATHFAILELQSLFRFLASQDPNSTRTIEGRTA